jgi:hypothetical protein
MAQQRALHPLGIGQEIVVVANGEAAAAGLIEAAAGQLAVGEGVNRPAWLKTSGWPAALTIPAAACPPKIGTSSANMGMPVLVKVL